MKISCEVWEDELEGDWGPVAGVVAKCSRCEHETESFGTSDRSVRRCLVLMREECPSGENNLYTADSWCGE